MQYMYAVYSCILRRRKMQSLSSVLITVRTLWVLCFLYQCRIGMSADLPMAPQCSLLKLGNGYGTNPGEYCKCSNDGRVTHIRDFNKACVDCPDRHRLDRKMLTCVPCLVKENCGRSIRDTCKICKNEDLHTSIPVKRKNSTGEVASFTAASTITYAHTSTDTPTTQTMTSQKSYEISTTEPPMNITSVPVDVASTGPADPTTTDHPTGPHELEYVEIPLIIIGSLIAIALAIFAVWKLFCKIRRWINKRFQKNENVPENIRLNRPEPRINKEPPYSTIQVQQLSTV